MLGIDGGASSTRALVGRDDGAILALGRGGPSDHLGSRSGHRRVRASIEASVGDAVARCGLDAPRFARAHLGMTGLLEPDEASVAIEHAVRQAVAVDDVVVSGDMEIAHAGATVLSPGVLVYAGTGSNALGRDAAGRTARCGGWGPLIDDEGGGYHIGRAAVRCAYRSTDGRRPPTRITAHLLEHFGVDALERLLPAVYRDGGLDRRSVAALSRVVSRAAEEGDEAARSVLASAGQELGRLATCVCRALPSLAPVPEIYTAGGTFRAASSLTDAFRATVTRAFPGAAFRASRYPPVVGAYLLTLRASGVPLTPGLLGRLDRSLGALPGMGASSHGD